MNGLPKEELIDLVRKYAPDEFYTMIGNRHSGSSDAQKTFSKAKRSLEDIFSNEASLNDPDQFQESLMKVLKGLSGLEKKLPKKIAEVILDVIVKVEKATDEGYLYDHYSDYNFEPSEQLYDFIAGVATAMGFNEKIAFIEELEAAISNSSYSTFHSGYEWFGKYFTDDELTQLKTLLANEYKELPEAVVESYYRRVSSILSDEEKEKILEIIADRDDSWAVELSELLSHVGKRKKSILMLKRLISKNPSEFVDERLCFLYLTQLKEEKLDLREAIMKCMKQSPTANMLRKATELLPSERGACEEILEKQGPEELLTYLESSDRAMEGLALVKRNRYIWGDRVFTFYKKTRTYSRKRPENTLPKLYNKILKIPGTTTTVQLPTH